MVYVTSFSKDNGALQHYGSIGLTRKNPKSRYRISGIQHAKLVEGNGSDLLIINKTDLAPFIGANLDVMARAAKNMGSVGYLVEVTRAQPP